MTGLTLEQQISLKRKILADYKAKRNTPMVMLHRDELEALLAKQQEQEHD